MSRTIRSEVCARLTQMVANMTPIPTAKHNRECIRYQSVELLYPITRTRPKPRTVHSQSDTIRQQVPTVVDHIPLHQDQRLVPVRLHRLPHQPPPLRKAGDCVHLFLARGLPALPGDIRYPELVGVRFRARRPRLSVLLHVPRALFGRGHEVGVDEIECVVCGVGVFGNGVVEAFGQVRRELVWKGSKGKCQSLVGSEKEEGHVLECPKYIVRP